jgi:hypothetical protein
MYLLQQNADVFEEQLSIVVWAVRPQNMQPITAME